MNELIGTEEVVLNDAAVTETITETVDAAPAVIPFGVVDPEVYGGSAKRIQEQINLLIAAREQAIKLESGLTTKAGLSKACKAARAHRAASALDARTRSLPASTGPPPQ